MAYTWHQKLAFCFLSVLTMNSAIAPLHISFDGHLEWHNMTMHLAAHGAGKTSSLYPVERFIKLEFTPTSQSEPPSGLYFNQEEDYEYILRQWNELFANMLKEEKAVQNDFRAATNAQFKAGEQLRNAEANIKLVEPDKLASLHEAYEKSVSNLREAKMHQKEIKALVEKSRKINLRLDTLTAKKLDKIRSRYKMVLTKYNPQKAMMIESVPLHPSPGVTKEETIKAPTITGSVSSQALHSVYDPAMTEIRPSSYQSRDYRSQPFECFFETDTTDLATGTKHLELQPGLLFTETDPDLRPYFRDKELITCLGRLSKIGPYVYLSVEFQIASSHSQGNFGSLADGSLLRFKLMNDEYVSLYNLRNNTGRIDPYTGYTIFSGQYALGKQEIKKLSSCELDKMRVMWTTGYEDYDIYHIDFLANQINCLMTKK